MGRGAVEGNFTSLRPDPQELALMDSHLYMTELGLTPFPGFQLRGDTLQDKEQECSGEHALVDAGRRDETQQTDGEVGAGTSGVPRTGFDEINAEVDSTFNDMNGSYDPLFDSTIPELDFAFSHKRGAEELPEIPSEKRQRQQPESPDQTPSLTTNSTHESHASFFDTFDSLFGGGTEPPLVLPDEPLPDFREIPQPPSGRHRTSECTKEAFSLDEQDIIATTTREFLQVRKEPVYKSPYPVSGGPLGYLPSNPALHVTCVAVGNEKMLKEIQSLRAQLYRTTRERDQYKKSLLQYAELDGSGKSPEQLLREENAMLRRVSTRHQSRVDEYKKEAAAWRHKLHEVSTLYNNLLYEIEVTKRLPAISLVPAEYKPQQYGQQLVPLPSIQSASASNSQPAGSPTQLPGQQVDAITIDLTPESSVPQTSTNSMPAQVTNAYNQPSGPPARQPEQTPEAIMIDLTEEDEALPTPPPEPEGATLKSLRSKKYGWLQAENNTFKTTQICTSPRVEDDKPVDTMEGESSRT
ncbi:hypothetical protein BDW67DRAFT_167078 [Aspergillus spinulosporus]